MLAFVAAIFLSAFLLFQVQPILARYILPWYGGSPAVWTTCMLFFQVGLLAGYTYAHLLVSRFRDRPRWQIGIHLGLIGLSFLLLPITPAADLKPDGAEASPVGGIVWLLFLTVGLPYVVISASGPLLQHWFTEATAGKSPYRLYAVSNFGSLLGLLSYPILFEPHLKLGQQTGLWTGAYLIYAVFAGLCAWLFVNRAPPITNSTSPREVAGENGRASLSDRILWIAFAACGSILLLATTNQMCQDVAVVPFLWILPLSLYLISFIICFDHARWYWRPFWIPLAMVSVGALVYLLNQDYADTEMHLSWQITIYASALFAGCMVCHGEMVRLKPHPRYLTSFYLAVSLGGAMGGAFVSLVAPRIFSGYWELHTGLLLFAGLTTLTLVREFGKRDHALVGAGAVLWIQALIFLAFYLRAHIHESEADTIRSTRSFYGVLRVYESGLFTDDHQRSLYHGRISHGSQYLSDKFHNWPGTYYSKDSGVGVFFDQYRAQQNNAPMKVGVVGLGVGTLAAWAESGDSVRFYEINSQVKDLATTYFTYLENCEGDASVVLGDARITLEWELKQQEPQQFDALFVDAFSGDSIPIHLLTREAFELYFEHLKDDGVLVVHITNLHLDLSDPVRTLAEELGKQAIQIEYDPDSWAENYSRWVLISSNTGLLAQIEAEGWSTPWWSESPQKIRWTDDYSNLLQVIDWEE